MWCSVLVTWMSVLNLNPQSGQRKMHRNSVRRQPTVLTSKRLHWSKKSPCARVHGDIWRTNSEIKLTENELMIKSLSMTIPITLICRPATKSLPCLLLKSLSLIRSEGHRNVVRRCADQCVCVPVRWFACLIACLRARQRHWACMKWTFESSQSGRRRFGGPCIFLRAILGFSVINKCALSGSLSRTVAPESTKNWDSCCHLCCRNVAYDEKLAVHKLCKNKKTHLSSSPAAKRKWVLYEINAYTWSCCDSTRAFSDWHKNTNTCALPENTRSK